MSKVLITGGSSLLGKYLKVTRPSHAEVYSTWFTAYVPNDNCVASYQLDVTNRTQVAYVFEKAKPEVVIHCAAVGSVDYTETHVEDTIKVNVLGTKNVLAAARDQGVLFVYISTNAVFDGEHAPYSEEAACHPINEYGKIKRRAEEVVMETAGRWLIIRPFLLYGIPYPGARTNWVMTILDRLEKGQRVKLVNDTWWQPTYAGDAAIAIWWLIGLGKENEIYHVANDQVMTLYELGQTVAKIWGYDTELIQPISSSELSGIVRRPKNTAYTLDKIHALRIRPCELVDGLNKVKEECDRLRSRFRNV